MRVEHEKIAVRRTIEPGMQIGIPAPCYMVCTCGEHLPVYHGNQVCPKCDEHWDECGWRIL